METRATSRLPAVRVVPVSKTKHSNDDNFLNENIGNLENIYFCIILISYVKMDYLTIIKTFGFVIKIIINSLGMVN